MTTPELRSINLDNVMEREMRRSYHGEAARWWTDNFRRSLMESKFAVPLESLNYSTRLESQSNLVIDDDFVGEISHDTMTNPVYDQAFPEQKYDLLR